MGEQRYRILGTFWSGELTFSLDRPLNYLMRDFIGEIIVADDGRFYGQMTDTLGAAKITHGKLANQTIKFRKEYSDEAKKHGASRKVIYYEFTPTRGGGWFGQYHTLGKVPNLPGNATMILW